MSSSVQPRFGFVIDYVNDVEASRRFYEEQLGIKAQRVHPTFVQFEHFAIAGDEPLNGTGDSEVYWLVDDAEAALKELSAKAEVSVPMRELPFGKVFAVKEPEGRPRFILQLAASRPSQVV
jgi:predicted enzyme related to lactoylglutathione lyase